jgi:GTP cyclohydrolase I
MGGQRLMVIETHRIENAVSEILAAVGEDPNRDGLRDTPRRIAEMYQELFAGLSQDPVEVLQTQFEEDHREMVILRDIPFYSMCEHHLLPFFGVAHIGYIPKGAIVGISKLARALEALARRPQVQERLTSQVADSIVRGLNPSGVAVVIEAEHLCMSMRGIQKPGTRVITSAVRGDFLNVTVTRQEFLNLVHGVGR